MEKYTIEYYKIKLAYFDQKVYDDCLTRKDYKEIIDIISDMKKHSFATDIEELNELAIQFLNLKYIYENIISGSLYNFIKNETSLLHLVLANDKKRIIKLRGIDGYLVKCQFHSDNEPSMHIFNTNKGIHCYGCGIDYDAIQYIENIEHIGINRALSLLCRIYLIDSDKNLYDEESPVVKKYREVLFSKEYKNYLTEAIKYTKNLNLNGRLEIFRNKSIENYIYDLDTIERVRNNEHLVYDKQKTKKLNLQSR